jgi:uncharacterized membrane protein YdjX (TVP38/TMEM64 family)
VRIIIAFVLLITVTLVIAYRKPIEVVLEVFLEWIRDHPYEGPLVLSLAYIIATVCWIPGSILTLGAGWAFNLAYQNLAIAVAVGASSVWIGAELGSISAFLIGRYLFRPTIEKLAKNYKITVALEKAI